MAFIKRTWLARLGTGLNKFLIGDKGADGKQTLTNSPDTVVQEGDVISADNLNDLEDRISDAFDEVKWKKVWTNPDPDSLFSPQEVVLDAQYQMIMIFYRSSTTNKIARSVMVKKDWSVTGVTGSDATITFVSAWSISFGSVNSRTVTIYVHNSNPVVSFGYGSKLELQFNPIEVTDSGTDNSKIVPTEIYVAGDIFKDS